jgi:Flp pilus assembly protein TadG
LGKRQFDVRAWIGLHFIYQIESVFNEFSFGDGAPRGVRKRASAIRPPQKPHCQISDGIAQVVLAYFTIFFNQLDNLRVYSPKRNKWGRSPFKDASQSDTSHGTWLRREMMFRRAEKFSRLFGGRNSEGGATVACAVAMPLLVLALAVGADYAKVSHFRSRVQVAAEAASLATAETVARQRDIANNSDALADQVADFVFIGQAPRGAGTPTVAVKSAAAAVTANVGYAGLAPSNFGSAFGYDDVSVEASSTSLARVADTRSTVSR